MLINTPSVIGVLQQSAPASAVVFSVDPGYAAYLAGKLGIGDWTYARLRFGQSVEEVKITGVSGNLVTVVRGEIPTAFAAGTELKFEMTFEAVSDLIAATMAGPAVTLNGDGGVTCTETSPNVWTVSALQTTVSNQDGSIIVNSDGNGNYIVAANTSAIGCCTSTSTSTSTTGGY
jgi:predicted regulator of Ras-like GTPase activity (Roadblock/LC7/MglB family)